VNSIEELSRDTVERAFRYSRTKQAEAYGMRRRYDPTDVVFHVTREEYQAMAMCMEVVIGPLNSSLGTNDERIFGMRLEQRETGYWEVDASVHIRIPVSRFMNRGQVESRVAQLLMGSGFSASSINVRRVP
jgi:hypothetical protein